MPFAPNVPYEHIRTFAAGMAQVLANAKSATPQPTFTPSVVAHEDGSLWTREGKLVLPAPEKASK